MARVDYERGTLCCLWSLMMDLMDLLPHVHVLPSIVITVHSTPRACQHRYHTQSGQ